MQATSHQAIDRDATEQHAGKAEDTAHRADQRRRLGNRQTMHALEKGRNPDPRGKHVQPHERGRPDQRDIASRTEQKADRRTHRLTCRIHRSAFALAANRLANDEDGIQAIERVREFYGAPLPALLITGDTSPEQVKRVHDSGHQVLFKPVRTRELYAVLRAVP